ncbi:hypothetical protein CGRA01v4_04420 [Colletotrichum graminicola]|nr:hypothetical protein CGRA01v4_04420 [Colletotrichum graminicola]
MGGGNKIGARRLSNAFLLRQVLCRCASASERRCGFWSCGVGYKWNCHRYNGRLGGCSS